MSEEIKKTCTHCSVKKPLDEFSLQKSGNRKSYCRECENKQNRDRYQRNKKIEYPADTKKMCDSCGVMKFLNEFYRNNGKFGRYNRCIVCMTKAKREKYWEAKDGTQREH